MYGLAAAALLLSVAGCAVDPGPIDTFSQQIDAGTAESVTAEVRMGAGNLHIESGASQLMNGSFRYSERFGRPNIRYDVTGAHGRLTIESAKGSSSGDKEVNTWDLQMGSAVPLEMIVSLGAGESNLDMSKLPLRSLDVSMGAGEMDLNVAGKYGRDVTVHVNGGVGEARIRLPKDTAAVVEATGGIGDVSAKGMTKRDGKYYNDAYADGKPAVRMEVHGGIGNIELSVEQ
jgi:hypothetical protein